MNRYRMTITRAVVRTRSCDPMLPRLVALDVDYRTDSVVAACVAFDDWSAPTPSFEKTLRSLTPPPAYEPGHFYRREMPYLLGVLALLDENPDFIIVDGFVWLDEGKPGLGAHLHEALAGKSVVVGVAKRPFREALALPLLRGISQHPLFVSAAGMETGVALEVVRRMHGPHRVPTLLQRVDRLSRT